MTSILRFALVAATAVAALAQPKHVILITIDGGAAFHLENPHLVLPNIRALAQDGVWAESSESVFPSITYPPTPPSSPASTPASMASWLTNSRKPAATP